MELIRMKWNTALLHLRNDLPLHLALFITSKLNPNVEVQEVIFTHISEGGQVSQTVGNFIVFPVVRRFCSSYRSRMWLKGTGAVATLTGFLK